MDQINDFTQNVLKMHRISISSVFLTSIVKNSKEKEESKIFIKEDHSKLQKTT